MDPVVSFTRRIVSVLVSELVRYVMFSLNVPFVLSLLVLIVTFLGVLVGVYAFPASELMPRLPLIGSRIQQGLTLDTQEIFSLYAKVTFALFLIGQVVRAVLRLKPTTLRRRLLVFLVLWTLAWGFVAVHQPMLPVAPGSTSATTFDLFFYLLGMGSFALWSVVTRASQALVSRLFAQWGDQPYRDQAR